MNADDLAKLHAAAFVTDRSWSGAEFAALLDQDFVHLIAEPHGFALTRTLAGESELLTVAVDPAHQKRGLGRRLLTEWLTSLEGVAETAFLEVAADNAAAIQLYRSLGFVKMGTRAGYYLRKDGASVDALLLSRMITHGHAPVSTPWKPESG